MKDNNGQTFGGENLSLWKSDETAMHVLYCESIKQVNDYTFWNESWLLHQLIKAIQLKLIFCYQLDCEENDCTFRHIFVVVLYNWQISCWSIINKPEKQWTIRVLESPGQTPKTNMFSRWLCKNLCMACVSHLWGYDAWLYRPSFLLNPILSRTHNHLFSPLGLNLSHFTTGHQN